MAKIDVAATTSSTVEPRGKRWVEVPQVDLFEYPYPTIRVNLLAFGSGRHFIDSDLADTVEERIKTKNSQDVALMQRNPDMKAVNAMDRWGIGRSGGGKFVSKPDEVMPG